jgi:hypothetical protein
MSGRFQRLQALFDEGVAVPAAQRAGWCAARCADDSELARELLQMLVDDERLTRAQTANPLVHASRCSVRCSRRSRTRTAT